MTDKLRKEVRDYIRQQYHLNGGGMVCGNLNDLISGFAEKKEKRIEELETEHNKLLDVINNQDVKIADLEQQIEKMKCYLPVAERNSDHKWFAYKNLFDTEWKIDYSVQGELPKCNTIKWFENKEAVMFYLVSNGMKYYEEPMR